MNFVSFKYNDHAKLQEFENINEIKPFQNKLEKIRSELFELRVKSFTEIRSSFESLKVEVYSNADKEPKNVDYFKAKMFDIESKIRNFKEIINEEWMALLKDEENLCKDLEFFKQRIHEWGKSVNEKTMKPVRLSSCTTEIGVIKNPITEFQKFVISTGGHCGGWSEQDHLLFLKERNKYKGKEKFVSVIQSLLPDLSLDEIMEHELWYRKYESLKSSQKEAIQKWKNEKAIKLNQKIETLSDASQGKTKKRPVSRKNIAERIRKWKEQQLSRKIEEEKRLKIEKQKLQEEERKRKEMYLMKRNAVNQYKIEKLNKVQEVLPKTDKLQITDSKTRNASLKFFRLQDLKFVEKKKIIHLQLESKKTEKLKLAKPAIEIILQRDPQRIFQPTLIWSQHCQQDERKEKVNPVFNLNTIQRFAVPEWRKELKF